jgi:hypothetical protein
MRSWLLLTHAGLAAVLLGCGSSLNGTYHASVEEVAPPKHAHPGYSLAEVRAKLEAEPEQIELRGNGRFVLRRAGATIWEGKWRAENDRLYLRAEVVQGVAVLPQLQSDKIYTLRSGAIVDEGRYSAYGLHLIYRRK